MAKGIEKSNQYSEKCRAQLFLGSDGSFRARVTQGHSLKVWQDIDAEMAGLQKVTPESEKWCDICYHGTHRVHAESIRTYGLFAGGAGKGADRVHIHLVRKITADKEQPGVRSGTDTIVRVDMRGFFDAGGVVLVSKQSVQPTDPRMGAICWT